MFRRVRVSLGRVFDLVHVVGSLLSGDVSTS
jgi:hypothetical protein